MIRPLLNSICIMMLCIGIICSCADENDLPENTDPIANADFANVISEQLHLFNATEISGEAPTGPSVHSLKISFKDTLYLNDTLPRVVKFQHLNPGEDVSGIYLQVFIDDSKDIINATHYYDIPEQPATSNNDSVSIFLIGLKENDLPLPTRCKVRIVPHKKDGTVIAEAIKDIVIEERQIVSSISNNGCGLVLPSGQSWYWEATFSKVGSVSEYFPETTFDSFGQEIQGCCIGGNSDSGASCLNADPKTKRTLHFPTSYQIALESFKFFDNGTFARITLENTINPMPSLSNFCAPGIGVVKASVGIKNYSGNWKVIEAPEFMNDTQRLTFANITSTGTGAGFGNRGGYIHELECEGSPSKLTLIDPDPEGNPFGNTRKIYVAIDDDQVLLKWHAF